MENKFCPTQIVEAKFHSLLDHQLLIVWRTPGGNNPTHSLPDTQHYLAPALIYLGFLAGEVSHFPNLTVIGYS